LNPFIRRRLVRTYDPTPNEKKQGRVTEKSQTAREGTRRRKKILFTGNIVLLDLPVMGDPFDLRSVTEA
jgi:hypothetical protein